MASSPSHPHKRRHDDQLETSDIPECLLRAISPPWKRHRPSTAAAAAMTRSPWQLTRIRDLPEESNQDAVGLKDLLGDPLIDECWQFNYLHDIPFVMDAFDEDIRHLVKLHLVHGFWKRDDPNRLELMREAADLKNVALHCAPMMEMFGTHHSKMMILFRRDETAQVIIHTANMIPKDWTIMTNGVWKSPLLPHQVQATGAAATSENSLTRDPWQHESRNPQGFPVGSGQRFKVDLLNYLRRYDSRGPICRPLVEKLHEYDFSAVKAALVASVPGRHDTRDLSETTWGWAGLRRSLQAIPTDQGDSEIVVQISSIATLGPRDDWLRNTLFGALAASKNRELKRPNFKVVFPTADEIRRSIAGYASGGSIHTKIQSPQQAKQLQYLQPILYHWANDCDGGIELPKDAVVMDGGRNRAAPHIKTYIRFNKSKERSEVQNRPIDWALLTSANLSKQAWGEAVRPMTGDIRIASWEIGVLVWPGLFQSSGEAMMVGSHQTDTPDSTAVAEAEAETEAETGRGRGRGVIGLRIPYSIPLQKYGHGEVPWVKSMTHTEPDCKGLTWEL